MGGILKSHLSVGYKLEYACLTAVVPSNKTLLGWLVVLAILFCQFHESTCVSDGAFHRFKFTSEPSDVVVFPGKSAQLDCGIQHLGQALAPDIQWRKDSDQLILDSRRLDGWFIRDSKESYKNKNIIKTDSIKTQVNSQYLLSNGSVFFKTIDPKLDGGVYQCEATIKSLGTIVSRMAKMQIGYLDQRFSEEPQSVQHFVGDVAMFPCLVSGKPNPSVVWFKNDEELKAQSSSDSRLQVHSNGVLEISNVQLSDFSSYRCQVSTGGIYVTRSRAAQLSSQTDTSSYQRVPPRFVMRPKDKIVVENSTVVFYCGANGRDRSGVQPQIIWLKDGATIDTKQERRFLRVGIGSLRIDNVQESDAGLYTCRATNAEESVDADATLSVQVPPTILSPPSDMTAQASSDIELQCSVIGMPKPSVTWLKNGELVIPSDYFQIGNGNNLKIFGIVPSDAGIYQCIASNEAGNVQASAQIIVSSKDSNSDSSELSGLFGLTLSPHPSSTAGMDSSIRSSGVPSAPLDLVAVHTSMRFVTLSWQPPLNSGNSDVIGYSVIWQEEASDRERVANISTLEANIQQLRPSTNYIFKVFAWNSNGKSHESAEIEVETQPEAMVPDAPINLHVMALSPTSIKISWTSPQNSNGPIVTFKIHYYIFGDSAGEMDVNVVDNEYIFTDLLMFQLYVFRVVAYNANGPGMATDEVTCRTYSDVPSQPPQNFTAEAVSSTGIVLRWEPPPEGDQNGIITGYKIRYKQKEKGKGEKLSETVTTDGSRRMYDLTDLQKGTEYSIRIHAMTVNGSGPATPFISAETFVNDLDETSVPGPPTSLRVRPLTNSIVVSWTPPSNQALMIRGYILGYGVGIPDVYRQVMDARQRYHTIKNLKSASEYVISLKAFNNIGEGRPIYETTQTREDIVPESVAPLTPPVGVKAIVLSSSTIILTWTDTSLSKNQRITDGRFYTVRYNPKLSRKPRLFNSTELNTHIEDLKPDTEYEFSIKVTKGQRFSQWSMSVFNKTKEAAPSTSPRDLTLASVEGRPAWASLSWQPPRQSNGQITGYLVFYTTDATLSDRDWVVEGVLGDRITTTIRDLTSETTYYFKVQARNAMGYGPMSPTVIYRTPNTDGFGGGMLDTPDDAEEKKYEISRISNDQTIDQINQLINQSINQGLPSLYLWLIVSFVIAMSILAGVLIIGFVCYKRRISKQNTSDDNTLNPQPKELKPPDLWIHDQMEMKRMNRNSGNSSTMMQIQPPASINSNDDTMSVDTQEEDRYLRPTVCPNMIPIDHPLSTRDPLMPLLSNGHILGSGDGGSYSCAPHMRPLYPRSQFSTSTPRVNAGDIAPPPSEYSLSTLERQRARNDIRKMLGSNQRLTTVPDTEPSPPTYQNLISMACSEQPEHSATDGPALPRRMPRSFKGLLSSSLPSQSAPGSPIPSQLVRPTQLQSRPTVQSSLATTTSIPSVKSPPPNLLSIASQSPPDNMMSSMTMGSDNSDIPKSFSTEELTAEMANLEGLMKDLSAITQHEFQC